MLIEKKIIDAITEFIDWILMRFWEEAAAKLLKTTSVAKFVDDKREQIESVDPKRFEAEQVAAIAGIPAFLARFLCRIAVRQGRFTGVAPAPGSEAALYALAKDSE
jgi:hypothetical protein